MSLRIESDSHGSDDLHDLVRRTPDRVAERGSPVSSRKPSGPLRQSTRIFFDSREPLPSVDEAIDQLRPLLEHLASVELPDDVFVDLLVSLDGKPLGSMYDIAPDRIELLQRAGSGLVLDAYCTEELH